MTAKEKQKVFIKEFLKPSLKQAGFKTIGNTWWKDKGDFFTVITLQNYSWNSIDAVDFRFNIGIALKALLKDPLKQKATYYDLVTHINETHFLPKDRIRTYCDNVAYKINAHTDIEKFGMLVIEDFENYILPKLDEPNNLADLITFYEKIPIWSENLNRIIKKNQLL